MRILATGATGYIGGRLAERLVDSGHEVRCMTRARRRLSDQPWASRAEVVEADARDLDSLRRACQGMEVVYYLVHSLPTGTGFAETDARCARNLAQAASETGASRLVYLGGMVPRDGPLSPHLASRAEVGQILLAAETPAVVCQAAVVIGSGSASFEMLRYLTERLPAMVTPRWVETRLQPIAVRDVLRYLEGALTLDPATNRAFDIAGPDILTYEEMMQRFAAAAGLRRRVIVKVPLLSLGLSAQWVNLVTPIPRALASPLIESLRHEMVASESDLAALLPGPLTDFDTAVRLALRRVAERRVDTRWSTAAWPAEPAETSALDPDWAGGPLYEDLRSALVDAPADIVWHVVEGIGGERGWYSFPLAWAVRGFLDRLVGGVGLRRGRRDPDSLGVGESLDFWRVEALERGLLLRLRAEMRLPGEASLTFSVAEQSPTTTRLTQRAAFRPRGLLGHAYWWSVKPFHGIVFKGMLANMAGAAERAARQAGPGPRSIGARTRFPHSVHEPS